jgi:hypothetical protein
MSVMMAALLCSLAVNGVYEISTAGTFPEAASTLPLRIAAVLSAVLALLRVLSTSFSDTGRRGRERGTAEVSEEKGREEEHCA